MTNTAAGQPLQCCAVTAVVGVFRAMVCDDPTEFPEDGLKMKQSTARLTNANTGSGKGHKSNGGSFNKQTFFFAEIHALFS